MYLEPIFSSEDIMRQMPTEARHFKQVDKTWRAIMDNTIKDTHVLEATEYKNMFNLLKENNSLLEKIQKGLNDYLEKKRLFFPRYSIYHFDFAPNIRIVSTLVCDCKFCS